MPVSHAFAIFFISSLSALDLPRNVRGVLSLFLSVDWNEEVVGESRRVYVE